MKLVLLILLGMLCQPAFCQQNPYFENSRVSSGTPYWTAKSDPVNGNTVIVFFDEKGNLLYREALAGQLIKPSRRNIRRFDKMLHLMVENKLVVGRVDTTPFPLAPGAYTLTSQQKYTDYRSMDSLSVRTRVFADTKGKLSIYFYNPRQSLILISLVDENGKTMHEEKTYALDYGRDFDISQLKMGVYSLSLLLGRTVEKYTLEVGPSRLYSMNRRVDY